MKKYFFLFLFSIFLSCSSDDSNNQPAQITVTASNFSISIDENPSSGQVLGNVVGTTNQGAVTFSISEQTPSGAFGINTTSGELTVLDETLFDFEINPVITGIVKVANGSISEDADITLNLNDIIEEIIFEGDVDLKTQDEVNTFGANNYTRINGLLNIGDTENNGTTDITDLTPLQTIEHVDNSLVIINNTILTSTEGLNVNFILGQLAIINNPSLESIKGFSTITSFWDIFLFGNDVLTDVSGLGQVNQIGNNLVIVTCPSLPDIDWLQNLTTIGRNLSINNCTSIANIDGLSNLTNFSNDGLSYISITSNDALENVDGLQNLNTTIYNLSLEQNESLQNIQGVANINVLQSLRIRQNESLQSLIGLGAISSLSTIIIEENHSLENLLGIENLENSFESFIIKRNENLVSLNGLEGLNNIFILDIDTNMNLTDFCSLQNLFTSDTNCYFNTNDNAYNPTKQDIIDGNCSL